DHAVLPQEFPRTHQRNRRFFSVRGDDSYSQPALLHVKNRVGRVALRIGRLILIQIENLPAQPSSREKGLGIEKLISISWLGLGRLKPCTLRNFARGGFCGPERTNRRDPPGWTVLTADRDAPGAHITPPRRRSHFHMIHLKKAGACGFCSILQMTPSCRCWFSAVLAGSLLGCVPPRTADIRNFFTESRGQINLMILLIHQDLANLFGHRIFA